MVFNMRLERCSQRNQGGFGSFLQYQSFMWTAVCGLFHEHIEAVFIFAGDPQDHRLVATQQWVSSFSTLTRDKVSRSLWMSAHRRTVSISWPEPVWHWSSPCSMPLCRIWSCFGAKLSNFGSGYFWPIPAEIHGTKSCSLRIWCIGRGAAAWLRLAFFEPCNFQVVNLERHSKGAGLKHIWM